MKKSPKWLPTEVREHTEQLIKKGGLGTFKPILMRLVTNPDMENVWKNLSSQTDDPQKLIDFLEYVRLHSALHGKNTTLIPIPSDKEQRKVFKKLNELSNRMIKEMRDLSSNGKSQAGWGLLETALRRAELYEVQQASQKTFLEIKSIQSRLHDVQEHESIISILELIGSAEDLASNAPDAVLPKKRNSSNAKRNLLIINLKQYLQYHFNTESPSLIANIVNTAFDSEDGGGSPDDVRKLKP